ncbi:hypothetical protein SMGES_25200 [Serratia marcescens]|nr:hypothetical protein SMGES_25200 [Serratia marcescens]
MPLLNSGIPLKSIEFSVFIRFMAVNVYFFVEYTSLRKMATHKKIKPAARKENMAIRMPVTERSELSKSIIAMAITRYEAICINPSFFVMSFLNLTIK